MRSRKNSNARLFQAVDLCCKQEDPDLYVGLLESKSVHCLDKACSSRESSN